MQNPQKNLYKKLFGYKGEKLVVQRLKKLGYKILEENYTTKFGEADIICSKDGVLVFVEVKSRTSCKFGTPSEAVNYKKQQKYRNIANFYLLTNNLQDVPLSFMIAEVIGESINLIEEAF